MRFDCNYNKYRKNLLSTTRIKKVSTVFSLNILNMHQYIYSIPNNNINNYGIINPFLRIPCENLQKAQKPRICMVVHHYKVAFFQMALILSFSKRLYY